MKEHLTFKHRYFADFDTEEKWIKINNYGIKKSDFQKALVPLIFRILIKSRFRISEPKKE